MKIGTRLLERNDIRRKSTHCIKMTPFIYMTVNIGTTNADVCLINPEGTSCSERPNETENLTQM